VTQVDIMYPVFVQVLLTIVVYCLLGAARTRAVRTVDRQRGPDLAMGTFSWPDDAAKRANNQRNQFELPVLFYAVVAFALILKGADLIMIVLAWVFGLGFLIVVIMWIKLLLHVLSAGPA
jgi:hypothetical protein